MVCNGSVCPCTQTEETYVCTDSQTVYLRDQMTRTPSLANPPILTTPPGIPASRPHYTPFTRSIKNVTTSFIKPYKRFITPSIIMPICWKPSVITPQCHMDDPLSNRWEYWKPECPRVPGLQLIILKHPVGNLVDDHPKKRDNIDKISLFDTILTELLSTIDDFITSLKYNDKHMAIVNRIKIPKNPVLRKLAYTHLKSYHKFRPLSFYGMKNY